MYSVTQNGKPLEKEKYTWDEETRTFSTREGSLVLDFREYSVCTFKTGDDCTFNTGSGCTFDTGCSCTFDTGSDCIFDTGPGCTFKTGYACTFNTSSYCTFKTDSDCTFKTGYACTFDTGFDCTFKTDSNCTFKTGFDCTFKTGSNCTFKTGEKCVIVRRDEFEIIQPKENEIIKLCPYQISGYISKRENENAFYMNMPDGTRQEHIIADSILSKVISKKTIKDLTIYKVINHNKTKESFLVFDGENYSHGDTLKEAKESLIYKISNRDTSEFEKYSINDELDKATLIKMYRAITGACEAGTRYFCENNEIPDRCTIKKAIELTKGQYNADKFEGFFKEAKQ